MAEFQQPLRTVVIRDPALRQFEGGFTAIPNRILENTDISLGARMTYAMLLKYAWQKDFCWPAQERLGLDLGLKSGRIRYHLDELRKAELIAWKRQGLNRPNIYYILKLPDAPEIDEPDPRYPQRGPDRQYIATPDRQSTSAQERQRTADKEYSKKNTQRRILISLTLYQPLPLVATVRSMTGVPTRNISFLRFSPSAAITSRSASIASLPEPPHPKSSIKP